RGRVPSGRRDRQYDAPSLSGRTSTSTAANRTPLIASSPKSRVSRNRSIDRAGARTNVEDAAFVDRAELRGDDCVMDLTAASATDIALLIRLRRASVEEVVDAHLARIEAVNPFVNAVVRLDAEGARRRAREADAALGQGDDWGPLHGVPFTLKDMHAAHGMAGSLGSRGSERIAAEDGIIAERLKRAGGILLGKT